MADAEIDPHDDKVRTVPLPSDMGAGADRVILQQNQSPEVAQGGGEWPSPSTPPTDAAPGGASPRSAARTAQRNEAEAAGDDKEGEFPAMREVLEADPVAGGTQSTAEEDEDAHGKGGDDGPGGAPDQRWGGSRLP